MQASAFLADSYAKDSGKNPFAVCNSYEVAVGCDSGSYAPSAMIRLGPNPFVYWKYQKNSEVRVALHP